ncbi:hypothetical protein GOBAR_DD30849 [Gossypium barbadense]|nr:hypothetical protein GOBAR_DD30849 [Gossypium barbadense]
MADEAKAKGNAAFSSGDFNTAVKHFTEAINLSPTNHVLYSNRSAAYASLHQYDAALSDAKKTVDLKPDWSKGYSRLGAAHLGLHQYEDAVSAYKKGIEIDPNNEALKSGLADAQSAAATNFIKIVIFAYEDCIKDCEKAVERGRELRADYKMIAKALTRKGTALVKMAKCSKDYEPAIETFQKALTEHRNPDTLKKLNDAEKAKKELEQQEYFDPKIADEEREKGNESFKQQKYPEAVKHYTESLRRNPKDPKAYSNRAACYTKLGALPEGLKDAEKCIELDPTFSKGYTRKGAVQFFMKEYDKALETYQEGLKHDPNNQELLDGVRRCVEQINRASRGDFSPEELKERQAKAMQDPEIQNILSDPVMRQVLVDFQENPKAAQEHTKNPMVMNKIQKLVTAGIVQLR